jgi:prepilin-type N-terminal cleavage/methylation domain-containing protein/prepilin-type processing-associated H-X9-DG protein
MKTAQRDGFTLIELLAVMAIITILAAILFPVFAQARDKARQTACMSNLKQQAMAMLLYSDDHDDALPPVLVRPHDEPVRFPSTWMAHLQPYLKNTAVFVDPASGRTNPDWQTCNDLLANYAYPPSFRALGYQGLKVTADPFGTAMSDGLGGFSGFPIGDYRQAVPSFSRTQVARPTETILICDHAAFDWGLAAKKLYYPTPRHLREPDLRLSDGSRVPQGRINAAFVDGHVRSLKHEQFWVILRDYSRLGRPSQSVFRHFWPYE